MGTADGNLAIFEDKTVKVNVESVLHQKIFKFFILYMLISTPLLSDVNSLRARIINLAFHLLIFLKSCIKIDPL